MADKAPKVIKCEYRLLRPSSSYKLEDNRVEHLQFDDGSALEFCLAYDILLKNGLSILAHLELEKANAAAAWFISEEKGVYDALGKATREAMAQYLRAGQNYGSGKAQEFVFGNIWKRGHETFYNRMTTHAAYLASKLE